MSLDTLRPRRYFGLRAPESGDPQPLGEVMPEGLARPVPAFRVIALKS